MTKQSNNNFDMAAAEQVIVAVTTAEGASQAAGRSMATFCRLAELASRLPAPKVGGEVNLDQSIAGKLLAHAAQMKKEGGLSAEGVKTFKDKLTAAIRYSVRDWAKEKDVAVRVITKGGLALKYGERKSFPSGEGETAEVSADPIELMKQLRAAGVTTQAQLTKLFKATA